LREFKSVLQLLRRRIWAQCDQYCGTASMKKARAEKNAFVPDLEWL